MTAPSPGIHDQLERAIASFRKMFGREPTCAAAAPGRVNLIGEHTDYNDGFVLPMAIERQTLIVAAPRADQEAHLVSTGVDSRAVFPVSPDLQPGQPAWANYVRGVVHGCLTRGLSVSGFDALIDSTVPTGAGLSSSAALEVAAATLIEALTGQRLDPVDKALLCQQAEHTFAGMPCGIMDQFISALGQAGQALLIDCRSHQTRAVPMDDPALAVLIVDSKVKHELTGGEYAQRRAQCEAAARALEVSALRDATLEQLAQAYADEDQVEYRRARHVIRENQRTLDFADAAAARDWAKAGQLMFESHASLRDDFEVSCPELDLLVELAAARVDRGQVWGSRMTGGGFGGCTVSLVRAEAIDELSRYLTDEYRRATGRSPAVFATRPAQGAHILPLDRG